MLSRMSTTVDIRLIASSRERLEEAVAQLRSSGVDVDFRAIPHSPGRKGDWLAYGTLTLSSVAVLRRLRDRNPQVVVIEMSVTATS